MRVTITFIVLFIVLFILSGCAGDNAFRRFANEVRQRQIQRHNSNVRNNPAWQVQELRRELCLSGTTCPKK